MVNQNGTLIEVTQDDIDFGTQCDPCRCPIAMAVNRDIPGAEAYVNADGIVFYKDKVEHDYGVSDEVVDFMDAFDAGETVRPFSFTIEVC